ncbi:MAG: hypothetical protein ACOC9Y_05135, partial [Chloroflexota bacterium]
GWRVEMGNVGLHYYAWRYEEPDTEADLPDDDGADDADDEQDDMPEPPETGDPIHSADLESWSNVTYEEGTTFYAGSGFHIRVDEPQTFIYHTDPDVLTRDAHVTTSLLPVEGEEGEACLATRVQANFSANYAFCATGAGDLFAVFEEEAEGGLQQTTLFELDDAIEEETFEADGVQLSVIHAGNNHWFQVDGEVVGHATHDGPTEGDAGVFVFNRDADRVEFIFRDFTVSEVETD